MLKSMTGYGRNKINIEGREYCVEIKSVNNRYSDISVKIPRTIGYLEEKVKKIVSQNINRGKVDVFVNFYNESQVGKEISINKDIAKTYIAELKQLSETTDIRDDISIMSISKLPDVLNIKSEEDEELIWTELNGCLEDALKNLINMKQTEGKKIADDLTQRIKNVSDQISQISDFSSRLVEEYIVKLESRIKEILKTDIIDEARLAQEVVIYSDKCSIQEELTRLNSHITQFLKLLESNDAIGKKMDFIIQEINREVNTIGSKANSLDITNIVINVKTQMEDIREQVQNIE